MTSIIEILDSHGNDDYPLTMYLAWKQGVIAVTNPSMVETIVADELRRRGWTHEAPQDFWPETGWFHDRFPGPHSLKQACVAEVNGP